MNDRSVIHACRRQGFTLTEVLITMALALIVLATVLSCHLFGMRLFEVTKAKLGASDEARGAISTLISEIRSAKVLRIGSGTLASFAEVIPNQPQVGNAIQIYPTIGTNTFIRYFWDATDQKLKRATNDAAEAYVVAHAISNQIVFTAEDFTGRILTNNENNRVIGLSLQFYQLQYPAVSIGPGNHYDYYQLRTKITRRAL